MRTILLRNSTAFSVAIALLLTASGCVSSNIAIYEGLVLQSSNRIDDYVSRIEIDYGNNTFQFENLHSPIEDCGDSEFKCIKTAVFEFAIPRNRDLLNGNWDYRDYRYEGSLEGREKRGRYTIQARALLGDSHDQVFIYSTSKGILEMTVKLASFDEENVSVVFRRR